MHRLMTLTLAAALVASHTHAQTPGSTPNTLRLADGAPHPPARVPDLTFRRQGDALEIFLALRSGDQVREEKFTMRRVVFP
jgi:hypothetical protein